MAEMALYDLCEPLFEYVCAVVRAGKLEKQPRMEQVRARVKDVLSDIEQEAANDHVLSEQFGKVKLPLVYFVDSLIVESDLDFAERWDSQRLAYEYDKLAGDEEFFTRLDETLEDESEAADERLLIYYACIGLGFTGMYKGREEELEKRVMRVASRVKRFITMDKTRRICPDAYVTDERDFTEPPGRKISTILYLFISCLFVFLVGYYLVYQTTIRELVSALNSILDKG